MRPLDLRFRRWRMRRLLKRHPIPPRLWHSVTRRMPTLRNLDAVQMAHLREMATWFIDRKSITGAQGLLVTPAMKITIAAQACLLILHREVAYFDGWVEVILYPGAFRVSHRQRDALGLIHDQAVDVAGESWLRGPLVLSWNDVERDCYQPQAGHNVVVHEFAHKLDGLNGAMDGMPPLHRGMNRNDWASDLNSAYQDLCRQVAAGQNTAINPYAATSPAEFFAVVSEYFFTAPKLLASRYPAVHKQLALFYQQEQMR